jgi:hypothetical protein
MTALMAALISVANSTASSAQAPKTAAPGASQSNVDKNVKAFTVNDIPGMHVADDIPRNFPMPNYTSNVVRKTFVTKTKAPISATAQIVTKDQPDVAYEWYKSVCQSGGWTFKSPNPKSTAKFNKGTPFYMLEAKKDRDQVYILCLPDTKSKGTAVSINWSRIKK